MRTPNSDTPSLPGPGLIAAVGPYPGILVHPEAGGPFGAQQRLERAPDPIGIVVAAVLAAILVQETCASVVDDEHLTGGIENEAAIAHAVERFEQWLPEWHAPPCP